MDCTDFREHVLTYIDGELPPDVAAGAAEHERACPDCAAGARLERAFEERTRAALLADAPDGVFGNLLAAARERTTVPAAGRVVPFRRAARALASLAAVALVAVTAMWSLCIPPFECAYLQAIESVASDGAAGDPLPFEGSEGVPARFVPPARLLAFDRIGEPEAVQVGYRGGAGAVRAVYDGGGERFVAIWSDLIGSSPSFRRHVEHGGLDWWIAEEHGRTVVTFLCGETQTLCALVGELPEERLVEIASQIRCP